MAESETLLRDHVSAVVYLLENLGFVINYPKSELTTTQEIEFLGFSVNSTKMELKLPREKIKKIRSEAVRSFKLTQLQPSHSPKLSEK